MHAHASEIKRMDPRYNVKYVHVEHREQRGLSMLCVCYPTRYVCMYVRICERVFEPWTQGAARSVNAVCILPNKVVVCLHVRESVCVHMSVCVL